MLTEISFNWAGYNYSELDAAYVDFREIKIYGWINSSNGRIAANSQANAVHFSYDINPSEYEFSMQSVAILKGVGSQSDLQLNGYIDQDFRGQSGLVNDGYENYYFMTLFSNETEQQFTLELVNTFSGEKYQINEPVSFNMNAPRGTMDNPLVLTLQDDSDFRAQFEQIEPLSIKEGGAFPQLYLFDYVSNVSFEEVSWNVTMADHMLVNLYDGILKVEPLAGYLGMEEIVLSLQSPRDTISQVVEFSVVALEEAVILTAEETSQKSTDILIYPNPAKNMATIEYSVKQSGMVSIHVINTLGMLVDVILSKDHISGTHQIEWERKDNIPNGLYLIQLIKEDTKETVKFYLD